MAGILTRQDIIGTLSSILVVLITFGLTWFVGQRLTVHWAIRQKHRELELVAASEFYKLYGEFFAVYKLWAYLSRDKESASPGTFQTIRWELLQRASSNEGALESLFVKLAAERSLTDREVEILGRFRQAFQSLRESIRDSKDMGWYYQEHPKYLSLKRLAYLTARIINSESLRYSGEAGNANSLVTITSGVWENAWVLEEEDWIRLQPKETLDR